MAGNSFGTLFRVTTFGESHGNSLGCVIDGCPAGIHIEKKTIQNALDRRRPGVTVDGKLNPSVTARKESDEVEILSGIFNDTTEGTPIALVIKNTSQHSNDYNNLEKTFRPGHADYSYEKKYGFRDFRGGGRSSGRETAGRVAAGAVACEFLKLNGIKITAYTIKAASIKAEKRNLSEIEENSMRAPDNEAAKKMQEKIEEIRKKGDSAGGIIECIIDGLPCGLGEPVFDKFDAELAKAMLSIGAVKGFEIGDGFSASESFGSQNNDEMRFENDQIKFLKNSSGGTLGGITCGNQVIFRIAVKPVPSIFQKQMTVSKNGDSYENTELEIKGRHDVCLCPRIVPVVEAMTALVCADMLLRNKNAKV